MVVRRLRPLVSLTLALLCLGGCGWSRQRVAELFDEAGGGTGDPEAAAESFAELGDFLADEDPGEAPVRAAAMEAMASIALARDYRTADAQAWDRLLGILAADFRQPRISEDEVEAGQPAADEARERLRARALWNLGRLGGAGHIAPATAILADPAAAAETKRAAIDLLARNSAAVAADPVARAAAVAALARRLGLEPGFEPASVRHLVGALVDLPTLVPLLGHGDGAARIVALRWLRQVLTATATTRTPLPADLAAGLRDALLAAAATERPVAIEARAALVRWLPAAWAGFCLAGAGPAFPPAERCDDLALVLPDLDLLARAAVRPGGGDGWSLLRDGVLVIDERAALAPEVWTALRGRMVGRILEQAAVAEPESADRLCAAVLRTDPAALATWFAADPKARPPAFAVRYLAALAGDPAVTAQPEMRTRTWQALAGLLAVADPALRSAIGGVLTERDPVLLATAALAALPAAEAEAPPAATALAQVAIATVAAIPQARPDLKPLAVVFRRGLVEALPAARALLVGADPGLLADLTLAERFARGTADPIDAQILADLLQAKALDSARAAAVEAKLRELVDGADEDAALAAAACLLARARAGGGALPASRWPSVQRLAELATPPAR